MLKDLQREKSWLSALSLGDGKAFENIYNLYWERLYAVAYNRLRSQEAAEEILQDLFSDLWQRRASLHVKSSLCFYLQAALKYKILNYLNARSYRQAYSQEHPEYHQAPDNSTQEILDFEELYEKLVAGIEKLPEKCKLIFKMSREKQMSSKEIAEELSISPRTAETHIHNALKVLKADLADFVGISVLAASFLL